MIFNIRGTSGSGKSHIVHSILNSNDHEVFYEVPGMKSSKIGGYYVPKLETTILGKYDNVCGGCDRIPNQDVVCGRICRLKDPNLIFEGLLISHSLKRYHLLAKKSGPIIFCFLNTTPENCIKRVYERRVAAGKLGVFNEENIHRDWRNVFRCRQQFKDLGHIVYELDSEKSVEEFMEIYSAHRE